MSFTTPLALLLLLAIPFIVWLGWPRGAGSPRRFGRWRDWISLALRLLMAMHGIDAAPGSAGGPAVSTS